MQRSPLNWRFSGQGSILTIAAFPTARGALFNTASLGKFAGVIEMFYDALVHSFLTTPFWMQVAGSAKY